MQKKDIDVVERTMVIVEEGLSAGPFLYDMKTKKIKGVFTKELEVMQRVLEGSKKKAFKDLEDFLDSCYSDEWEFICLYPDLPVGRVENNNLNVLNTNTRIDGGNKIHIGPKIQHYGGRPSLYIALEVEWCGTYNIIDYFVLRNRKYNTKEEYDNNHC